MQVSVELTEQSFPKLFFCHWSSHLFNEAVIYEVGQKVHIDIALLWHGSKRMKN